MNFIKQFSKSLIAVFAILMLVFLLLLLGVIEYNSEIFGRFFIGAGLLALGQSVFLTAIDESVIKAGRAIGNSIMRIKNIWIVLLFGFIFGFVTTIAEPDVQVLVGELLDINPLMSSFLLISIFGIGAGLLIVLAFIRILKNLKLKWILLFLYAIIFILATFCPETYFGLAFDSGGVSTGVITVPFILSLMIGICAIRSGSGKDDNFGAAAIISTGPIIAVLCLGIILGPTDNIVSYTPENAAFITVLIDQICNVVLALSPLILTFLVMQFFLLKIPTKSVVKILIGFLIVGIGLICFLTGIYYGFSTMGIFIGNSLALSSSQWFVIIFGFFIGWALVFTEPAIIVLVEQIEDVTTGFLKKSTVFVTLACGVAFAVSLAFIRIFYQISLWYFLLPFYAICIILNFIVPKIFSSIAFDGGGIAAGTMAVAFILPICVGICNAFGYDIIIYAFGVVGLVATAPILAVQVLGLIYMINKNKKDKRAIINLIKEKARERANENIQNINN
ncbi:MAG: DUF1538 domain-containing protein [Clostridia bacterium]|nr:DUF1538 domain-containing protein [Clostridia bacterium]